jgi:branched-chain amino acid aminotransferase
VTPAPGALQDTTRRTTPELCAELGLPAEPARLSLEHLTGADEVFISSTAGAIMAVTKIDGRPVRAGQAGPITKRLAELYWQKHEDPDWTTSVD